MNVGQDRPETQHITEESARFMSDPTRAVKCVHTRCVNWWLDQQKETTRMLRATSK